MGRTRLAVGLAGLMLLGGAQPAVAAVDVVPVHVELRDLLPGGSRSRDVAVHVRAAATVTAVEVVADGAPSLTWDTRLCDAGGTCRPFDASLVGTRLDAGTWTVGVTAVAAATLAPGDRSTVTGRLELLGGDDTTQVLADGGTSDPRRLARTGTAVARALAAALTALATGAWLVVLARRRVDRADDPEGARP